MIINKQSKLIVGKPTLEPVVSGVVLKKPSHITLVLPELPTDDIGIVLNSLKKIISEELIVELVSSGKVVCKDRTIFLDDIPQVLLELGVVIHSKDCIITALKSGNVDLSNYFTKEETIKEILKWIANIDLDNYYTKGEVDEIIDNLPITPDGDIETYLTEDITSMLNVGGIQELDLLKLGTSFTSFVKKLVTTTFYPTIVNPSMTLLLNTGNVEAGSIVNLVASCNFNRGAINGSLVGGIWQSGVMQDYRSGPSTSFVINLVEGTTSSVTFPNTVINEGSNRIEATVRYSQGPLPKDSNGSNFLSPLPSGSITAAATANGQRYRWHGTNNNAITSEDIRALQSRSLNPSNGNSYSVSIPIGAYNVIIAYPASLRDITSVKYVEGLNAEVKDIFSKTQVIVSGANGYNPIPYKVYMYTPAEPFSATATYNVTI